MTTALALSISLGLAAGITGCGPAVDVGSSMGDSGSTGSMQGSTGSPQTSGPVVTTASSIGTTDGTTENSTTFFGSSGGSEESTGLGRFIQVPVGGGGVYGVECSVWAQDCIAGENCVPWANDGGNVWNSTVCRPIDPLGHPAGDPCVVEDSMVSGFDDCDANSVCFDVDPATLEGTCVAFCEGSGDAPTCADRNQQCVIENEGVVSLCLDTCDPLGDGCDKGRSCVAAQPATFVCVRPGESVVGEECTQFIDCMPGSSCLQTEDAAPVCTSPCSLLDGVCELGSTCLPWGETGLCVPDEP